MWQLCPEKLQYSGWTRGAGSQSSAPVVALCGWGDIRALWFTSPSAENENVIISGLISDPYHPVLSNMYVYKSLPLIFFFFKDWRMWRKFFRCGFATEDVVTSFPADPALYSGQEWRQKGLKCGLLYLCLVCMHAPGYITPHHHPFPAHHAQMWHADVGGIWLRNELLFVLSSQSVQTAGSQSEKIKMLKIAAPPLPMLLKSSVHIQITCARWCWDFCYK